MRRSIIVFDLDGTLADSMAQVREAITSMAVDDLGIPEPVIRERLPYLLSLPASQAMPELAAMAGKDVGALDGLMRNHPERPLTLFPEVPDVLARLAAGYTLVLSTNSPMDQLDDRLRAVGVRDFFHLTLGTDIAGDVIKGPRHMTLAAERLGLTISELGARSVLVGDQEGDMRLAKQFAMIAIGRMHDGNDAALKASGADYVVTDLNELEAVLDRISGD